MKNPIIVWSQYLCKGLIGFTVLLFLFFTGVIIHWHFSPEVYQQVDVSEAFRPGYGIHNFRIDPNLPGEGLWLSDLSEGMIYWLFIRGAFFFIVSIILMLRVLRVLSSITTLHTFYHGNIEHFRVMARWAFIAFLVSCFNFLTVDGSTELHLTFAFPPFLFAVACLILAEVFRSGKELLEDKSLII